MTLLQGPKNPVLPTLSNIPSGRFVEAIPLLEEEVEGPGSSPVNRLRGHPYIM